MAGPIRISVLASASRARRELASTEGDLNSLGRAGDRASGQLRSSLAQTGSVFARLRQEAETHLDRIPKDAAGAIDRTSQEFQSLSPEMRRAVQDAARVASNELRAGAFNQAGEQAGEDAGEGFASSLTSKVKSAGPALAGAFAALGVGKLFADALDQDAGTDKLAASLGATPAEARRYGQLAGKLYSEAFGDSVGDIRTAIGAVQGNFRNLDGGALEDVTRRALTFADVFEVDVARASQVAGQAVRTGLAKNATQAFDLLTAASQKVPPSLREDVLDAADEYGGFFKQIGYDGEQAFAVLARGAGKGMYGIDKAGDAVKEFGILVTTDLARTKPVIEDLGLNYDRMADSLLAGGPKARRATNQIIDGILGIESPSKRARTAVELFGTPLEDLGTDQIPSFLRSLKSASGGLGDFEGATDRAGKTAYDNASSELKEFGRGLQQDVVKQLAAALPEIRATARELSSTFGPALKTVGGIASSAASFFAKLPGPVKEFAGAAALAALALPRLVSAGAAVGGMATRVGSSMATAGAGTASFVTGMRNAETRATTARNALTRMGGAARGAAGIGGLAALTAGASTSNDALGILANVGGGALLGFSVGGPIGAAVGGTAGALLSLATNSGKANDAMQEAPPPAERYADTLDRVTGAATRATRAEVLRMAQQENVLGISGRLGIANRDLIGSVLGEAQATRRVAAAYRERSAELNPGEQAAFNKFLGEQTDALADQSQEVRNANRDTMTWKQALKGLPKDVKIQLRQLGFDPTREQMQRIIRDADDLSKKDINLLIREFGAGRVVRNLNDLRRRAEDTGRANPNFNPFLNLLTRGTDRGRRVTERGSRDMNRNLGRTGRTRPQTGGWERLLDRNVDRGKRVIFRGTNLINRDLARAGRAKPQTGGWSNLLTRGLQGGQRATDRGVDGINRELNRGTGRAKPNLNPFMGLLQRNLGTTVGRARKGGSDVARGATDPVNKARPNMSGYVGGVGSGVSQARGVGSSGGFGVGSALKSGVIAGFSGTASALAAQARAAVLGAIAAGRSAAAARSPSRKMMRLGRDLSDGLAVGMASRQNRVNNASRKVVLGLIGAAANGYSTILERLRAYGKAQGRSDERVKKASRAFVNQAKALQRARAAQDKLTQRVQNATGALKDAIRVRDEYAKSVRDSFVQYGSVTSIEEGHLNSTSSFLDQLKERATKAREFATLIEDLRKQGLNQTSLRQILEAGPEAGRAAADAIAAGGKEAVDEVNRLTNIIGNQGKTLGDRMGKEFYQAGIDAKKKLLDGLKDKERNAEKRAVRLAAALLRAWRKRLDLGGGGKGKGKNRRNAAEMLLGTEAAAQRRGEQYGRLLARGVRTGFNDLGVRDVTARADAKRATSAKATATAAGGAARREQPHQVVPVEITARDLSEAVAGRVVKKWIRVANQKDGKG